jgi:predicted transcriptional regulator
MFLKKYLWKQEQEEEEINMKKIIRLTESDLTRIVKRVIIEEKKNKKEMDWKKMGFESNDDYQKFLDTKMKDLLDKIKNTPDLLNVFKRLHNK